MALSRNGNKPDAPKVWYRPIKRDSAEFMYLCECQGGLVALDAEGTIWQYGEFPTQDGKHVQGWVAMDGTRYEVAT